MADRQWEVPTELETNRKNHLHVLECLCKRESSPVRERKEWKNKKKEAERSEDRSKIFFFNWLLLIAGESLASAVEAGSFARGARGDPV